MIDQKTIEHIAKLARLRLSGEEAQGYADQLSKVLTHFQQISKINTDHIEPLVTPIEIKFHGRPDDIVKENTADEILANAPDKAGHLFKVPPVV